MAAQFVDDESDTTYIGIYRDLTKDFNGVIWEIDI
jgi:hypothetical protein